VQPLLKTGASRDLLSGTALGHPAHPLLVDIPIGCWTSAVLLDLTTAHQQRASRRLLGFGVLASLPAIATGLSDWSDTDEAEARVGLVHASLNSLAIGCFAISWWRRRLGGRAGRRWSLVGAVLASGAGWLGGHLAFALGVGIDTNAFEVGPADWTIADGSQPREGAVACLTVGGVRVAAVRSEGALHALADRCGHRGGPLSEGDLEDGCLVCPWHGSRFELGSGLPVHGPASVPQPVYQIRVADDGVQLRRSEKRALRQRSVRPGRSS
jgi:nitrite reductase/ring-hydroxylating ferredoxin subunit/uncharacterized membrane protein